MGQQRIGERVAEGPGAFGRRIEGVRDRQVDLVYDGVHEEVVKASLAWHVVVDGAGVHAQLGAQAPHRERLGSFRIHHPQSRLHDPLTSEQLTAADPRRHATPAANAEPPA
jgi:hypothetical protein